MLSNKSIIFLLPTLFMLVKTANIITVYPVDNNIVQTCLKNVYQFEFKVRFSEKLDKIIPFEIIIPYPNRIPFKCILDGPNSKFSCFHSFANYVWSLSANSKIELPYSFPNLEGIRWDYDSFLRRIYRSLWTIQSNCGLEFEIMNRDGSVMNQISEEIKQMNEKNEIIADVDEILDGKCHSSQYDYTFNMKMKLNSGEFIEELKTTKNLNKTMKISFLQDIYTPVLIGNKRKKGITSFRKDYEYKYAKCKSQTDITQDNFDKKDGFIFECHLSVSRNIRFQGPLQIKPFIDHVYVSKTDKDGKTITKMISFEFDIITSTKIEEEDEEEEREEVKEEKEDKDKTNSNLSDQVIEKKVSNLRRLDFGQVEPNFLILDSNLDVFICPDKPVLTIKNYQDGIGFGGLNTSGSKYLFLLFGFLSNGYEFIDDTLTLMDMTKEEIKFNLRVTDNLEGPDDKKKIVKCSIPTGTSINKNELIEVKCIGTRKNLENNHTDLILNWNLEENNLIDNLLINWPTDYKSNKKHIFYYNIQGLSLKKNDYGCFENKYYFYLYVYDLKAEPKISFNLPLIYPKHTKAECKLYNSVTFKCSIDLRLKKISKGRKIIISTERKFLFNKEQNIVLYYINNNTNSSDLDFSLPIGEDCGDIMIVGALKDVGYSYLQVIIIIISCIVGLIICVSAIGFCVIYEITHRNRKGPYYKYTEEKQIPNTSVTQVKKPTQ